MRNCDRSPTLMSMVLLPGGWRKPLAWLCLFILVSSGCAQLPGNQVGEQVAPMMPQRELLDQELLNVSIQLFDPGELPQSPDKRRGLSAGIREAEARFAPIHLKHTLQRTGHWGVVRVIPEADIGAEVTVKGRILLSDGESAVLQIEVVDARNVVWFNQTYAETAQPEEHYATEPEKQDTFQDLFTTIANDLARYKSGLGLADIQEIRQVANLKYAQALAPDAFTGYLAISPGGSLSPMRLPAESDPMLSRIQAIKVREEMLVDTINGYYDIYYHDLWDPYVNWRRFRQEEIQALRKLEKEAFTQQLLGFAAIAGAIALGAAADSETSIRTRPLQDVLIAGGAYSVYSGFQTREEGKIHQAAIEELGQSFSSEAEPLVFEVEGKAVELNGSAEQQYAQWKSLLRELYFAETGLPPEPTILSGPSESSHGTATER